MILAAISAGLLIGTTQNYDLTEEQVQTLFDQSMKNSDGELFHQVMLAAEVKGVSKSACTKFLALIVEPWYKGPSIQRAANGSPISWSSPQCQFVIKFQPQGGVNYVATNDREFLFHTPTTQVGEGYKSVVGFADLLFARGAEQSMSLSGKIAKMKNTQKLVEGWITKVKAMGIKGSIDSDTNKWVTWEQIIKESRAEITKAEKGGRL